MVSKSLTYQGRNITAAILQTIFYYYFSVRKLLYMNSTVTDFCFQWIQLTTTLHCIGSEIGLVPNRRHSVIYTNDRLLTQMGVTLFRRDKRRNKHIYSFCKNFSMLFSWNNFVLFSRKWNNALHIILHVMTSCLIRHDVFKSSVFLQIRYDWS